MKLLAQTRTRAQRPASLLEWHRSFAWYPIPVARKGKLRYAWFRFVERKWGIGRYGGTMKWRYRLPGRPRPAPPGLSHTLY
jgi:hypothetical protein